MKLKMCSCRMCRYGRHKPYGKYIVRLANRQWRHDTKQKLKKGDWDGIEPNKSVPYTD